MVNCCIILNSKTGEFFPKRKACVPFLNFNKPIEEAKQKIKQTWFHNQVWACELKYLHQ